MFTTNKYNNSSPTAVFHLYPVLPTALLWFYVAYQRCWICVHTETLGGLRTKRSTFTVVRALNSILNQFCSFKITIACVCLWTFLYIVIISERSVEIQRAVISFFSSPITHFLSFRSPFRIFIPIPPFTRVSLPSVSLRTTMKNIRATYYVIISISSSLTLELLLNAA
jgi:hypothetical protein